MMPREITVPQKTYIEDFMVIEELPNNRVRVVVGVWQEDTNSFDVEQFPPKEYIIEGNNFAELIGVPTNWAPDKPSGTYRNEDLWHYIDLQRNANA
jgi:hypothetical protein